MKTFLLPFMMLLLMGPISHLKAQSKAAPDDRQTSANFYPVHISDKLNNQPWLKELIRTGSELNTQNRTKGAVVDEEGDERTFFVANVEEEDEFDEKEFRLMRKGTLTQIWFEIAEIDNGHLNDQVADSIFKYLEDISNQYSFNPERGIIDLSNDVFGDPPNYDGDNLVDFLITDIQDGWDPEEGGGFTAGFFFGVDQFPDTNPLNYRSNERDVLYIDSYPGIFVNGEADPLRPLSTLAHEYQHLIHWNYNEAEDNDEFTFINEAQSNFASLLNGYFPHTSYNRYLNETNVPIFRWRSGSEVLPDYGRAASFASYLWDQLGFENAGYLTRDSASGVTGINNSISNSGSTLKFPDILVNWGIANLLNDITVDRAYGYEHVFLDELTASIDFENPSISDTVEVHQGGISYIGFQQAENLNITVEFSGTNGRARFISVSGGTTEIHTLESGETFTTPSGEIFDTAYIMMVNTTPSPDGSSTSNTRDFTVNVSGDQIYDLNTVSTYSNEPAFYWNIPYQNASGENRLGFSNQFTADTEALLHSLELFIVSGEDGSTGETIEVKGEGQLRIALYSDENGEPGTALESDSIDFNQLSTGWQTFEVTDWNIDLEEDLTFHIVYEAVVPNINPSENAIPLRLDDGAGDQDVTYVLTGPEEFTPMFENSDTNGDPIGQHGVWNRIILAHAVNINDEELTSVPQDFELSQNYPNPFNPSTNINFKLPKAADVQLTIYNTLGQQVATLVDENMAAGNHTVSWNSNNLASGVYLYTIKAADFVQTRKMILLK